jgi:uncharacterized protein YjdB
VQFAAYGITPAGDTIPADVRWSASGSNISTDGLFMATAEDGSYQVAATSTKNGKLKDDTQVDVRSPLSQLIITPDSSELTPGGALQFAAYGRRRGDSVAVAATYTTTEGTITASGAYTAGDTPGSHWVIATENGPTYHKNNRKPKADSASVNIVPNSPTVASVTVSPASASIQVDATQQLTATVKDSAWASSDTGVATVSSGGMVTGVAEGSTSITASSEEKTGSAMVSVTAGAAGNPGTVSNLAVVGATEESVILSFTEVHDGTGQPAKYDVRVAPSPISWGSAASVAQGTCATPVVGTSIGATHTCTVLGLSPSTVYGFQLVSFRGTLNQDAVFGELSNVVNGSTTEAEPAPVASVSVSPVSASIGVGATRQLTATVKDSAGNTLSGRAITWTSSNVGVASVSSSGVVTGVAEGSATITATCEGQSGTSATTVTASPPGVDEPFFGNDPTDALIWADGFEYGCIGTGQCGDQAFGVNYSVNVSEFTNNTDIVSGARPGSAGSKILEMRYGPSRTHNLVAEKGFTTPDHFFFQIWFKTSVGWMPTENVSSGIKGFMFWHDEDEAVYPRYQWGISRLDLNESCRNEGTNPTPHFGGTGRSAISGAHCQSYVYTGRHSNHTGPEWDGDASQPWGAGGFNDGNWHRVTAEIKAGASPEYMKWWYDGILVWDDTSVGADYPRPNLLKWFGNFPNSGDAVLGEIYFDDLTMWKR